MRPSPPTAGGRRLARWLFGLWALGPLACASEVQGDFRPLVELSAATSSVVVDRDQLAVGESLAVWIYTRDSHGAMYVSPSLEVTAALAGDANLATLGATLARGDGSYCIPLTARRAGVIGPLTVYAGPLILAAPQMVAEVVSAPLSTAPAAFAVAPEVVASGAVAEVTLALQDAAGAPAEGRVSQVTLTAGGGTSSVQVGPAVALGGGRYSGQLIGRAAGSPLTLGAVVDGLPLLPATAPRLQVVAGPPATLVPGPASAPFGVAVLAGATLGEPLQARAGDALGNPVAGLRLLWAVTAGSGQLDDVEAATDANGLAEARLTAGAGEGPLTVVASAPAAGLQVGFAARVVDRVPVVAAAHLEGCGATVADGSDRCVVTVTLSGPDGAPVMGLVPSLQVGGSANRVDVCSVSDGVGVATCGVASTRAESKSLALVAPVAAPGPSLSFVAGPADPSTSALALGAGPTTADGVATVAWTATLADRCGNPVVGLAGGDLVLGTEPSEGVVATAAAGASDAAGRLAGQLLSTVPGAVRLRVVAPAALAGLAPATANFAPWLGRSLVLTQSPAAATSGAPFAAALRVEVHDASGRRVTAGADSQAWVQVDLAAGVGSLAGVVARAAVAGVADFADAGQSLDVAGPGRRLRASAALANGLVSATSTSFVVAPGPAAQIALVAAPAQATAGTTLAPTVVAVQDAAGNLVSSGADADAAIAIDLGAHGPPLSGTTTVAASGGWASFLNLRAQAAGADLVLRATTSLSLSGNVAASAPLEVLVGPAAQLLWSRQPGGQATSGAPLDPPPQVTVADAAGNPVVAGPDAAATLTLRTGGGALWATQAAIAGVADFGASQAGLGPAGSCALVASKPPTAASGALTSPPSRSLTVGHGPAAGLVLAAGPPTPAVAGATWPLTVNVVDAAGNLVSDGPDASAAIALSLADGAVLAGVTTKAAVGGVASFAGLAISAAGAHVLSAAKADRLALGGQPTLGGSWPASVVAGPASRLAFVVQPVDAVAGLPWASPPAVQVEDALGNPVTVGPGSAARVDLTATGAGLGGASSVVASAGLATFAGLAACGAGPGWSLTASAVLGGAAVSTASAPFAVVAGAATTLGFTAQPGGAVAGMGLSTPPRVAVLDAWSNLVLGGADAALPVGLAPSPGCGPLRGASAVAATAGVADFAAAGLDLDVVATAVRLTATTTSAAGLPLSTLSAPFAVAAGPAAGLSFVSQPTSGRADAPWTPAVAVAVVDAVGNVVAQGAGSDSQVAVSLLGPHGVLPLVGPSSVAAVGGVASFPGLGSQVAGTGRQLLAAATLGGAPVSLAGARFDVAAGGAAGLLLANGPAGPATAQLPWAPAPQVWVVDAHQNRVTQGPDAAATVSLDLVGGDPLIGGTQRPAVAGAADFAGAGVAATRAASDLLRATKADTRAAGGTASVATTLGPLTVAPGRAAALAFVVQPVGGSADGPLAVAPQVQVLDAAGNLVVGGPDAGAALTIEALGDADLAGPLTVSASGGLATFAGLVRRTAGPATLRVRPASGAAAAAISSPLTVLPGASQRLAFETQPGGGRADAVWPLQPSLALYDGWHNLVSVGPDAGASVSLVGAAGYPLAGSLSRPLAAGQLSLSGLSQARAGRNLQLSASVALAAGGTLTATSTPYTVVAGDAARLAFLMQPAFTQVGAPLAPAAAAPVVQILDLLGNQVTDGPDSQAVVTLSASSGALSGGSSWPATAGLADFVAADLGLTLASPALTLTAQATLAGVPQTVTSAPLALSAGPATQLAFVVQPGGGTAATAWAQQPQLQLQDLWGNLRADGPDAGASVTLTTASGAALNGAATASASAGVAGFVGLSQDRAEATSLTAQATLGGQPVTATSAPYTVAPASSRQLRFVGPPPALWVSGEPPSPAPRLALFDGAGNAIVGGADATAAVQLTALGGGALVGTTALPLAAGVVDFAGAPLAWTLAGSGLGLRATKADTAGSAGGSAATTVEASGLSVVHGAAALVMWSPAPVGGTADAPLATQPRVSILDAAGNLVSDGPDASAAVTLSLAGGEALGGTLTRSAAAGVATFDDLVVRQAGATAMVATKADTATVVAAARRGTGPLSSASAPLSVAAGAASQLAFAPSPGGGVAGVTWPQQPGLQLLDAWGNAVTAGPDASAAVVLMAAGDGPPLIGTTGLSLAAGAAGLTDLRLAGRAPAAVLAAQLTLGGVPRTFSSAPFAVAAGPASRLAFLQQPGGGVAGAPWPQAPQVAVVDDYGDVVESGPDSTRSLTLALGGGGGGTLSGATTLAATGGVADFAAAGLSVDRAGSGLLLTAASGALSATSAAFSVAPGGLQLAWAAQPGGAVAGALLTSPPVVQVQDDAGRPVAGGPDAALAVTVSLAPAVATAGTLTGTLIRAAAGGVVSFPDLLLGQAGPAALTARAQTSLGSRQSTSATFTVSSGPATSLVQTAPPSAPWAAGTASRGPTYAVMDACGNRVAQGPDATAGVSLALTGGSGALSGTSLSVAAAGGIADFSALGLRIDQSGGKVLTATKASTAMAGGAKALTATTAVTVVPAAAAGLSFVVQPGGGAAGVAWAQAPQVAVVDAQGNVVASGPDASAALTLSSPAGLGGTTTATAVNGVASFSGVYSTLAGAATLTATKAATAATVAAGERGTGTLSQASAAFTTTFGAATKLVLVAQPSAATAGAPFPVAPAVQVRDAWDNPVTGGADASAAVTLSTILGPGAIGGAATTSCSAGQATFPGLSATVAGGPYQLRAAATLAGAGRQVDGAPFTAAPAAPGRLVFTTQPSGGGSSAAWPTQPVVQVQDGWGNLVNSGPDSALTVTLTLGGGSGALSGAGQRAAYAGVANFAGAGLAIDLAGTDKLLVASATSSSGLPLSGAAAPMSIIAGPASRLAFSPQPGGGTAHLAWAGQPSVRILDAAGNLLTSGPDASAAVTLTHSGGAAGALAGATTQSAVGGIASFTGLSLDVADAAHVLTASKADTSSSGSGGSGPLTAASGAFAVTAAAASQLAFAASPGNSTAGSGLAGLPLVVRVLDPYGNLVATGADATRPIGLSIDAGSLLGTGSQAAVGGVASFSALAATQAGSRTLTAQATLAAGAASAPSAPFAVAAGAASTLRFATQPGGANSAAALSPQPVVQVTDAWGNLVTSGLDASRRIALSLTSGFGTLSGTAATAAAGGIASFSGLSVDVPGSKTLTATASLAAASPSVPSAAFTVTPGPAASADYPFTAGSDSNYTISNSASVGLVGGVAALVAADQADASGAQFNAGQGVGVVWDSGQNFLRLGTAGGCAGLSTNCSSLDPSWTPQYGSIVAYWHFDGSGSVANGAVVPAQIGPALTAHNANGTGLAYVAGRVGQALSLDGSDDYLTAPGSFLASSPKWTFSGWINLQSLNNVATLFEFHSLASSPVTAFGSLFWVCTLNNQWGSFINYSGSPHTALQLSDSIGQLALGGWTHFAHVYDGATGSYYYNGSLVSTLPVPQVVAPTFNMTNFAIGGLLGSSRFLAATLDEFAFWGVALNANEIDGIYRRQSAAYAGTFTSRVYDGLAPGQAWTNLGWKTTMPFLKQLPSSAANEAVADYPQAATGLQNGIDTLWHLNEPTVQSRPPSGYDLFDDSGHGRHAALNAIWNPSGLFNARGIFGQALFFLPNAYISSGAMWTPPPTSFTYSVWTLRGAWNASGPIMGTYINASSADRLLYHNTGGNIVFGVRPGSVTNTVVSSSGLADSQWHHAVATLDATNGMGLYIDGKLDNANNNFTAATTTTQQLLVGGLGPASGGNWPNISNAFNTFFVDEVAVWDRSLTASEVLSLYRRGANRLRFQVRSCQQAGCADAPGWQGPDGSANTYYSELNNVSGQTILPTAANPAISVAAGRYFQYRAVLESDDKKAQCTYPSQGAGTYPCSPELQSVAVTPAHYDSTAPSIGGKIGIPYNEVTALTTTLGAAGCAAGLRYTFSPDGSRWFWYNGATWVASDNSPVHATSAAALTPAAMQAFAGQVGTGTLYFTAFLVSNGTQACALDDVLLTVSQ